MRGAAGRHPFTRAVLALALGNLAVVSAKWRAAGRGGVGREADGGEPRERGSRARFGADTPCAGIAVCTAFNHREQLGGWMQYHIAHANVTHFFLWDDTKERPHRRRLTTSPRCRRLVRARASAAAGVQWVDKGVIVQIVLVGGGGGGGGQVWSLNQ